MITDSLTMLRRDITHSLRNPLITVSGLLVPVFFLLIFVGVFGGALGTALPGGLTYVDYLAPGILVMAIASGVASTAVGVSMDLTEGVIDRFRTMAIAQSAVLHGTAVGAVLRTLVSVALTLALALLLGFRPDAGPLGWLGALGLTVLLATAMTWLGVAFGLVGGSPGGANGFAQIGHFLPVLSSAFVPVGSVPAGMRWFVEHQPFTPINETMRGLLTGTPDAGTALLAVAWCVAIAVAGYAWSTWAFRRGPGRATTRTAAQILSG
jgi:ABC-2 type transport system permease protein